MLKLHNTLTQQKEEFTPIQPGKIKIYVCGVTVYDYYHIGNARMLAVFDVIVRYLRWRGFEVAYVRNITDIDDKIIRRANENKEEYFALTERFIKAMREDNQAIGLLTPDHEPRATEFIQPMIQLIEKLIANGHAYVASNNDVNFEVRTFAPYGALSHHDIEQLESGARIEINDVKRDPLDFVLWKPAKPNEPAWDSPWGKGRPGWHIECSVMSMQLLGEHFDIHGGGRDLIFPHHENEIAQAEGASKNKFVNYWLHNGYLQIDKEKMSKSLGNFFTLRDLLSQYSGEVLRYFLVSSQYRSPLQYSDEAIKQAGQSLTRLYTALRGLQDAEPEPNSIFEKKFIVAMDDDFNTPIAMSVLFELAHEIQRLREKKQDDTAARHGALLKKLGGALGILQTDPELFLQEGAGDVVANISALIAKRNQAREEKNWVEADKIRKQLADQGVVLEDTNEGTTWKLMR